MYTIELNDLNLSCYYSDLESILKNETGSCSAVMPVWRDKMKLSSRTVCDRQTHRKSNYCIPRTCALMVNNKNQHQEIKTLRTVFVSENSINNS